jgi:SAM-dependent methyltransferase
MSMVMRPVDLVEAASYSPWPGRLSGADAWKKVRRSDAEILAEYDAVYDELEQSWRVFQTGLAPGERHPGSLYRFLNEFRIRANRRMAERSDIYGKADPRNYLVSVDDRLYLADLNLFELMHRQLLVEVTREAMEISPFGGVVEIGCGSGMNLANLHLHLGLAIAGCDLSPRAVAFLSSIGRDLAWDMRFERLNFLQDDISALAPCERWSLVSFHAIEQAASIDEGWFSRLSAMANPPVFGIHCEPLQIDDGTEFSALCRRYAEINLYNNDFLAAALKAEAKGIIKIIRLEARKIGNSAFNPSSVLVWRFSEGTK